MLNLLDQIKGNPAFYRQLAIDDQLVTQYNCPLETQKETIWTPQGYFTYVIEGKKIWRTASQSVELTPGQCIFVRKGAHVVEQSFDSPFCFVVFFISEPFIAETLHQVPKPPFVQPDIKEVPVITTVDTNDALHGFFHSIAPYFLQSTAPNTSLLELKFRELILNVIHNPANESLTRYFFSLTELPAADTVSRILEENFQYNLKLEEYARLCGKSLSSFKREVESRLHTTPGRWLLQRRLQHAQELIHRSDKTISEIAFESGFENVSHFSRAFKHQFGHSPARYRHAVA